MTLEFLTDRPEWIPLVASWYFHQWGHLVPGNSVEDTIGRIRGKSNRDRVPLHVVAVVNDEVLGVAQLKHREMDLYPEREFWLGSVFVAPAARDQGIGSRLCEKIAEIAKGLGIGELHLQTEALDGGLYRRLGWDIVVARVRYHDVDVTVMTRKL